MRFFGRDETHENMIAIQAERSRNYEDRVVRCLRRHGCRITGPRIEVVRALCGLKSPASAYELHEKVKSTGGKVDVVSVYRILDTLKTYGLVYYVGSQNAYFPVFLESASDRLSELVIHEDNKEIHELAIPPSILQAIEQQARALGVAVTSIKIELHARDVA